MSCYWCSVVDTIVRCRDEVCELQKVELWNAQCNLFWRFNLEKQKSIAGAVCRQSCSTCVTACSATVVWLCTITKTIEISTRPILEPEYRLRCVDVQKLK